MKLSKPRLHRLLSGRDELTAVDKDDVLAGVLAATAAPQRRPFSWLRWAWVPLAASLVLLVPWVWRSSEFAVKGSAHAELELSCGAGPCRPGGTLAFQVQPAGWSYVSIAARREGGPLIWYFDDLVVTGAGALAEGVKLGPEHAAGRYEVVAIFSSSPLGRQALRERFDLNGDQTFAVVRRSLVLEP